jgi:hypothetical protein
VVPASASASDGMALYESGLNCSTGGCHSIDGSGNGVNSNTVINNWLPGTWTFSTLQAYIDSAMPFGNAPMCTGQCAADTAAHISCAFNAGITTGC